MILHQFWHSNTWLIKWSVTWPGLHLDETFLPDSFHKIFSKTFFKAYLHFIATGKVDDRFNVTILWSIKKHRVSSCIKIQKLFKTISARKQKILIKIVTENSFKCLLHAWVAASHFILKTQKHVMLENLIKFYKGGKLMF